MLIGYARVTTTEPTPVQQLDALRHAGCRHIFTDEGVSAGAIKRPALEKALAALKQGDTLVIWRLDRLGRSLSHLIQTIKHLGDAGIKFRSISESIDTTSTPGCSLFHLVDALADFERALVNERTRAGMIAAKQRGGRLGRKQKLTAHQIDHARKLIDAGESPRHVAKSMGVSTATLYRRIPAAASNRINLDLFGNSVP